METVNPQALRAQEIRERLRNPSNAVRDDGIDLRRRFRVISPQLPPEIGKSSTEQFSIRLVPNRHLRAGHSSFPVNDFKPELPSLHLIRHVICAEFKVRAQDLFGEGRYRGIVIPRQLFCYLAVSMTGKSVAAVGRFMRRDHTTCLYTLTKMREWRRTKPEINERLSRLEAAIREH